MVNKENLETLGVRNKEEIKDSKMSLLNKIKKSLMPFSFRFLGVVLAYSVFYLISAANSRTFYTDFGRGNYKFESTTMPDLLFTTKSFKRTKSNNSIEEEVEVSNFPLGFRRYIDGRDGPHDGLVDYIYETKIKHGGDLESATKEFTQIKNKFSEELRKYNIE